MIQFLQDRALLSVEVASCLDGMVCLSVRGELDMYTAPVLRRAVHRAYSEGALIVDLDLVGLEFVDVRGAHALQEAGCVLTHVPASVRRILDLTFAPSGAV
jgi:anti-anti-sigma factor